MSWIIDCQYYWWVTHRDPIVSGAILASNSRRSNTGVWKRRDELFATNLLNVWDIGLVVMILVEPSLVSVRPSGKENSPHGWMKKVFWPHSKVQQFRQSVWSSFPWRYLGNCFKWCFVSRIDYAVLSPVIKSPFRTLPDYDVRLLRQSYK